MSEQLEAIFTTGNSYWDGVYTRRDDMDKVNGKYVWSQQKSDTTTLWVYYVLDWYDSPAYLMYYSIDLNSALFYFRPSNVLYAIHRHAYAWISTQQHWSPVSNFRISLDMSITTTINGDSATISGTAAGPGLTVSIFDQDDDVMDTPIATATATSDGAWTVTLTLSDGAYSFKVFATHDDFDRTFEESFIDILIDTISPVAPSVTTTPLMFNTTTPLITGTGEPGAVVIIKDNDDNTLGSGIATVTGDWAIRLTELNKGDHSLTATATDASNNLSPVFAFNLVVDPIKLNGDFEQTVFTGEFWSDPGAVVTDESGNETTIYATSITKEGAVFDVSGDITSQSGVYKLVYSHDDVERDLTRVVVIASARLVGTNGIGETLSVEVLGNDTVRDNLVVQWQASYSGIADAYVDVETSTTHVVRDLNQYLRAKITYTNQDGDAITLHTDVFHIDSVNALLVDKGSLQLTQIENIDTTSLMDSFVISNSGIPGCDGTYTKNEATNTFWQDGGTHTIELEDVVTAYTGIDLSEGITKTTTNQGGYGSKRWVNSVTTTTDNRNIKAYVPIIKRCFILKSTDGTRIGRIPIGSVNNGQSQAVFNIANISSHSGRWWRQRTYRLYYSWHRNWWYWYPWRHNYYWHLWTNFGYNHSFQSTIINVHDATKYGSMDFSSKWFGEKASGVKLENFTVIPNGTYTRRDDLDLYNGEFVYSLTDDDSGVTYYLKHENMYNWIADGITYRNVWVVNTSSTTTNMAKVVFDMNMVSRNVFQWISGDGWQRSTEANVLSVNADYSNTERLTEHYTPLESSHHGYIQFAFSGSFQGRYIYLHNYTDEQLEQVYIDLRRDAYIGGSAGTVQTFVNNFTAPDIIPTESLNLESLDDVHTNNTMMITSSNLRFVVLVKVSDHSIVTELDGGHILKPKHALLDTFYFDAYTWQTSKDNVTWTTVETTPTFTAPQNRYIRVIVTLGGNTSTSNSVFSKGRIGTMSGLNPQNLPIDTEYLDAGAVDDDGESLIADVSPVNTSVAGSYMVTYKDYGGHVVGTRTVNVIGNEIDVYSADESLFFGNFNYTAITLSFPDTRNNSLNRFKATYRLQYSSTGEPLLHDGKVYYRGFNYGYKYIYWTNWYGVGRYVASTWLGSNSSNIAFRNPGEVNSSIDVDGNEIYTPFNTNSNIAVWGYSAVVYPGQTLSAFGYRWITREIGSTSSGWWPMSEVDDDGLPDSYVNAVANMTLIGVKRIKITQGDSDTVPHVGSVLTFTDNVYDNWESSTDNRVWTIFKGGKSLTITNELTNKYIRCYSSQYNIVSETKFVKPVIQTLNGDAYTVIDAHMTNDYIDAGAVDINGNDITIGKVYRWVENHTWWKEELSVSEMRKYPGLYWIQSTDLDNNEHIVSDYTIRIVLVRPVINLIGDETVEILLGHDFVDDGFTIVGLQPNTIMLIDPNNQNYILESPNPNAGLPIDNSEVNITYFDTAGNELDDANTIGDVAGTFTVKYTHNWSESNSEGAGISAESLYGFDLISTGFTASEIPYEVTRTVIVIGSDTTKPVITRQGDAVAYAEVGHDYSDAGATVTDNADPNVVIQTNVYAANDLSTPITITSTTPVGEYIVRYDATDASGNEAEPVTRTVHVESRLIQDLTASATTVQAGQVSDVVFSANKHVRAAAASESGDLEFQVEDAQGNVLRPWSGVQTFKYTTDSNHFGTTQLVVKVRDGDGHESSVNVNVISTDRTASNVVITLNDSIIKSTTQITVSYTADDADEFRVLYSTTPDDTDSFQVLSDWSTSTSASIQPSSIGIASSTELTIRVEAKGYESAVAHADATITIDDEAPVIVFAGGPTVYHDVTVSFTSFPDAIATDNVDEDTAVLESAIHSTDSIEDLFNSVGGTYVLKYTHEDSAGNTVTTECTVIMEDRSILSTLDCPSYVVSGDACTIEFSAQHHVRSELSGSSIETKLARIDTSTDENGDEVENETVLMDWQSAATSYNLDTSGITESTFYNIRLFVRDENGNETTKDGQLTIEPSLEVMKTGNLSLLDSLQYKDESDDVIVTVQSVSVDGTPQNVFDMNLPLLKVGATITFDVSDSSNTGHPLVFKDVNGNEIAVTRSDAAEPGNAGATVTLNVTKDLHRYSCGTHGDGMGREIQDLVHIYTVTVDTTTFGDITIREFRINHGRSLSLTSGDVETFDVSDASNTEHLLVFKDANGDEIDVTRTGTPGESGATVTLNVTSDLHRYSGTHGDDMGYEITVSEPLTESQKRKNASRNMLDSVRTFHSSIKTSKQVRRKLKFEEKGTLASMRDSSAWTDNDSKSVARKAMVESIALGRRAGQGNVVASERVKPSASDAFAMHEDDDDAVVVDDFDQNDNVLGLVHDPDNNKPVVLKSKRFKRKTTATAWNVSENSKSAIVNYAKKGNVMNVAATLVLDEEGTQVSGAQTDSDNHVLIAMHVPDGSLANVSIFDNNGNALSGDDKIEVFRSYPSHKSFGLEQDLTDENESANVWILQKTFTSITVDADTTWTVTTSHSNVTETTADLSVAFAEAVPSTLSSVLFEYSLNDGASWQTLATVHANDLAATHTATASGLDVETLYTAKFRYTISDGNPIPFSEADNVTFTTLEDAIPVIELVGNATITHEKGTAFTDPGYSATDTLDGDITADVEVGGHTVNSSTAVGTYVITYDVTDASGNEATQVTRTVNVVDTTPPVITLNGPSTIEIIQNSVESYTDQGASATDYLNENISHLVEVGGAVVRPDTVGTYVITYDVTDASGNEATQVTRTVNVVAPPEEEDEEEDDTGAEGGSGGSAGDPYIRTLL